MKKILITIGFFLTIGFSINAQSYSDALRLSQLNTFGTARTLGVSGAFGAMGGDYGSININPAGIADYRTSEFILTPSVNSYSNDATLSGAETVNSTGSGFGIQNIAVVFGNNVTGSDWQTSNFSIGLSRISDFSEEFSYAGTTPGSITERFLELGNFAGDVSNLDNFEAGLAWDVGALYFDANDNFVTDFTSPDQTIFKKQYIRRSGKINQLDFAWAGNLNNKVNIGVSAGLPFFTFEETKIYEEEDPNDEVSFFERLNFTEFLNTSGVGFNMKLGAVFKPTKKLRIGAALHTPTWYKMDDSYYTSLQYVYSDGGLNDSTATSPNGSFDYRMTTPWRAVGSVGTIIKVGDIRGFINADVEYLDYRNNSFNLTSNSDNPEDLAYEIELNQEIDAQLTSAVNFRLGGEFGYDIWRFRTGFALNGSPYEIDQQSSNNKVFSVGLGLRQDRFYLDLGYQRTKTEEGYIPYIVLEEQASQLVNIEGTRGKFLVTAGFKF